LIIEWDPDDRVWITYVPEIEYLSTFGETREQALEQTREAIIGYLEAAEKEGIAVAGGGQEFEVVDMEVAIA